MNDVASKPLSQARLIELVSSRMSHDLASPLGAVGNGVELFALTAGPSEELLLISDALAGAQAKLEQFRIAFGAAQDDQVLNSKKMEKLFESLSSAGRHTLTWDIKEEVARNAAKTALLSVMCCQSALPLGGDIRVFKGGIEASGRRVDYSESLWMVAQGAEPDNKLAGSQVHFALLAAQLSAIGAQLSITHNETQLHLSY